MSDYEHHDDFHNHHDEQNHHEQSHENHQEHHNEEHHQQHHNDSNEESHLNQASAPPSDDNGYIVVPPTPQSSVDRDSHEQQQQQQDIVVAEADSSTAAQATTPVSPQQTEKKAPSTQETKKETTGTTDGSKSFLCPYYFLACDKLNKVEVPEKAKDLLLWANPKLTGAVFGSILVLLISLASFSLFTVTGSLLLLASTALGAYRFYLAVVFRIKGTYDETFDKLSAYSFSLPEDRVQKLVGLLENDLNRTLNRLKSVLIWDNISNSAISYTGFYLVYCLGSWFNTLTLLILVHVSVFTLPKVYQVYKKPIDQCIEKFTACCHQAVSQLMAKLPPFLQGKKKTA